LKFRGDYANAQCPLPTHKEGDKGKSFSINLAGNYWRCFSDSCNANNGGKKGGDVINFVACMEKCREKDAAQKLSEWFNIKTPQHIAEGSQQTTVQKDYQKPSTSGDSLKGYMATIDAWYDVESVQGDQESDADFRKRFLNALKAQMIQSYRAGKAAKI
jgi:DNA primase